MAAVTAAVGAVAVGAGATYMANKATNMTLM